MKRTSPDIEKQVISEYNNGKSLSKLGESYGLSPVTVLNILKRNKYLSDISLKKLEIGDEDNKNIINDILIHCKNEIKKLKIIGEEFNFIYKDIQDKKIEFNKLQKLILHINKEEDNENENKEKDFISSDNDKIKYLENNYKLLNFNEIRKIDLEIFSINLNDKVKIMNLYKNLYEIY